MKDIKEMLLDVMSKEEQEEYEDLLVLNKFYTMINSIIPIEIGSADRETSDKGYTFDKGVGKYKVQLMVDGLNMFFGYFSTEEEAKAKADELMELDSDSVIAEHTKYRSSKHLRTKGYHFNKKAGKYQVQFLVGSKLKYFGVYETEEEAINKVKEVRELTY